MGLNFRDGKKQIAATAGEEDCAEHTFKKVVIRTEQDCCDA